MNFLPLCTAMVCPTISGTTEERRDQVRTTFFSLRRFIARIFSSRCASMNGPFLSERGIPRLPPSLHSIAVGARIVTGAMAAGGLTPGRHRRAARARLAFAAAVGVVHRVHGHAAHGG